MRLRKALTWTPALFLVACNLIAGIEEREPLDAGATQSTSASSATSTSSSTSSSTSATAASSSSSSGDAGPSNCADVYVSNAGDDSEDGCDPKKPKKTIQAALSAAQASGQVMSILVCKGTYAEGTFNLGFAVSLKGGFDCTSWKPKPGAETILEANVGLHTVDISSASVTNAQKLSGFTIKGPKGDLGGIGVALWVGLSAAPEVFGNKIEGGSTLNKSNIGSIGMMIDSGATPHVHDNTIDGGTGTSPASHGSIGLLASGGSALIHDNVITGGAGKETVTKPNFYGSVGLYLTGVAPFTVANGNPIQNNVILGGTGSSDTDGTPSVGVRGGGQDLDLVSNVIDGGAGTQGNTGPVGALLAGTGNVQLLKNRITGGKANALMITSFGARGAVISTTGNLLVANNEILGGDSTMSGGQTIGLHVSGTAVAGQRILANTIVGGITKSLRSPAILVVSSVSGAVIQDNILTSVDDAFGAALELGSCTSLAKFDGNFLFNAPLGLLYSDSKKGACNIGPYSTTDAVQTELTMSAAHATDNKTMAAACGTDTGCKVVPLCTGAQACLDQVFAAFDAGSHGATTLVNTGWKLSLATPCTVAQGKLDLSAIVTDDLYGNARSAPFSIGAHQQNVNCQ